METSASILPGFGGRYRFELGAGDVLLLDLSKCASAVFVLTEFSGGGQVQLDQTFDDVNFASIQLLNTLGETKKFPITDAIGKIRCTVADTDDSSDSSSSTFDDGAVVLTVVGFPLGRQ